RAPGVAVASGVGGEGTGAGQRVRDGAAQPGGEERVAALHGRAAVAGPRVRVVVGDDVGAVGDAPAVGGQVVGEQGLLAAEEQQPVEAARFEVGAAADHRTAGQEAQDLGAGEVGGG